MLRFSCCLPVSKEIQEGKSSREQLAPDTLSPFLSPDRGLKESHVIRKVSFLKLHL